MKLIIGLVLLVSQAYAAEMTLYAINSPHPLNWSTPRTLLDTTIRSSINPSRQGRSNHTIGHAYLGFKCDGEEEVISGMTSGNGFTSKTNLLKKGHGFSAILQDNPGHFQDHAESLKDVDFFSIQGDRMSVMKVAVTNEQCLKAKDWHAEFSARTTFIYGGLMERPLTGEGSGCTAYVMSFLEIADVDYAFFNKIFEQSIYIPNSLLGGGVFGSNNVGLGIIRSNRTKLDVPAENTLKVDLYDPNRMYFWIVNKVNEIKKNGSSAELSGYKAKVEMLKNAKVLVLERNSEL
jgi:hypothetical protein